MSYNSTSRPTVGHRGQIAIWYFNFKSLYVNTFEITSENVGHRTTTVEQEEGLDDFFAVAVRSDNFFVTGLRLSVDHFYDWRDTNYGRTFCFR